MSTDWFTTRILVVDDNERVRDSLRMRVSMSRSSYRVEGVGSGHEALEYLAQEPFDVVLCDLVLRGRRDGIDVTREIVANYPGVRVVVFSGAESGERKVQALEAGAFSYLAKPINHDELLHAIETINSIRRTERLSNCFQTLARLSHRLQTSFDIDRLARKVVEGAQTLGYGRARLYFYDPEGRTLVGKAAVGLDDVDFEGYGVPANAAAIVEQIFRQERPQIWNAQHLREEFGEESLQPWISELGLQELSWIDLPLAVGNKRIGTLAIDNPERPDQTYTEEDLEILDVLAGLAAKAFNNAFAYEKEALANASLSSILRDAPDAVVTTDLPGNITFVSPSAESVIGYSEAQLLGHPAARFYTDEQGTADAGLAMARSMMERLRKDERIVNERIFLHSDTGPPRPYSLSVSLLRDSAGEAIGTLGICKDLGALEAQSREYRDVLEGFGYGTLFLNQDGVVRFVNRKAQTLLQRDRGEVEGRCFTEMILTPQRPVFEAAVEEMMAGDGEAKIDFSILRPDGRRLALKARLTQVRGQGGLVTGVAMALYDKSELGALIQSGRLMALGRMVAGVAHEINNPLNNMLVAERELEERLRAADVLDERTERYLDMIERNGERIRAIVERLRDFARPDELHMAPLSAVQVMRETISFFGDRFRDRQIELHIDLPEGLPKILGDATRLQQVFVNLLANAEDAMEGQSEPKTIRVLAAARPEGGIRVSVTDHGSGIPDGIVEAIFDPFFTTKDPTRGTGLGLSICRSILEMHHGAISVEKSPDVRGTAFHVDLPAADSAAARAAAEQASGGAPS